MLLYISFPAAGASGGPEREARMGEVNTATQEETVVPSTEVTLPPSKAATDPL